MAATNFVGTEIRWHRVDWPFWHPEKYLRKIFHYIFAGSFPFGCKENAPWPHGGPFLERLMLLDLCIGMPDPNGPEGEQEVLQLQREGP
jgi:hypothetical protein